MEKSQMNAPATNHNGFLNLLSKPEAAEALSIDIRTLDRLIADGEILTITISKTQRVPKWFLFMYELSKLYKITGLVDSMLGTYEKDFSGTIETIRQRTRHRKQPIPTKQNQEAV